MSKYFTLQELLDSPTALKKRIKNLPTFEQVENLRKLAETILDPVREKYGAPVTVSSSFRSVALNTAINGAKSSQHLNGEAADIEAKDNKKLFDTALDLVKTGKIVVGQLIWEYGTKNAPAWVHISLPTKNHRNEVLYIGVK